MPRPSLAHALTLRLQRRPPEAKAGATRVVLLGVGSDLRSDDGVGVAVADRVSHLGLAGIVTINGGTAPENATADVRKAAPTHLLIVDSADMGETPGTIRLIAPDEIGGISFGTHSLPLSVLAGYLSTETGCSVIVMGIQPRSIEFGEALSAEASRAADEAAAAIAEAVGAAVR